MIKILRTRKAEADLLEIWVYIADNSVDAADTFLDKLKNTFETLSVSPEIAKKRDELYPGLLSFPSGNYVIYFFTIDDGIELIRILHGSRDIEGLF